MTTTIDRNGIDADQKRGDARVRQDPRRVPARARALSPRLLEERERQSRVAAAGGHGQSPTGAISGGRADVRTEPGGRSGAQIAGWRAERSGRVERLARAAEARGRAARRASREGACVRRRVPSARLCAAVGGAAVLVFLGLGTLAGFGGAGAESAPAAAAQQVHSGTGLVTVRAGQSLADVAAEVAPGRPTAQVVAELAEINGVADGSALAGRTLVTPRY